MQLTESALVRSKIEDAYGQIRTGGRKDTKSFYNKGLKGLITGMSAMAAALVLSVTVCVSNPALAAKLPFIGNIFQTVNVDSSYPGVVWRGGGGGGGGGGGEILVKMQCSLLSQEKKRTIPMYRPTMGLPLPSQNVTMRAWQCIWQLASSQKLVLAI